MSGDTVADDKYLEKVRGLLAKAASTEFADEAEALTDTAMRLMTKYGIDAAALTEKPATVEEIVTKRVDIPAPYTPEKFDLLGAVARHFDCRVVLYGNDSQRAAVRDGKGKIVKVNGRTQYEWVSAYGKGGNAEIVGFPSQIEQTEFLYTLLLTQATGQMVKAQPPYIAALGRREHIGNFRSTWLQGFTTAIRRRLHVIKQDAVREDELESGGKGVLVLADRRTLVEARYAELYPNLTSSLRLCETGSGRTQGYESGLRADLNQTRVGETRTAIG